MFIPFEKCNDQVVLSPSAEFILSLAEGLRVNSSEEAAFVLVLRKKQILRWCSG
jgi:hypothetical protein